MQTRYAQLTHALDAVEGRAASGAFTQLASVIGLVEVELDAYLQATRRHPHAFGEASAEVLWRHFARLRDAAAGHDAPGARSAGASLRADLLAHHRAHHASVPPAAR